MKHTWRSTGLLLVIALLACGRAVAAQANNPMTTEDSVRAVEGLRRDALLNADTVALSRITAPEFYEVSRFGQIRTRAMNLSEIATGTLKLDTIRYDSVSVRVYGDVAILTGIADNSGVYRGQPFTGRVRYTRTFVRRDSRWQAVTMQHTPMP